MSLTLIIIKPRSNRYSFSSYIWSWFLGSTKCLLIRIKSSSCCYYFSLFIPQWGTSTNISKPEIPIYVSQHLSILIFLFNFFFSFFLFFLKNLLMQSITEFLPLFLFYQQFLLFVRIFF